MPEKPLTFEEQAELLYRVVLAISATFSATQRAEFAVRLRQASVEIHGDAHERSYGILRLMADGIEKADPPPLH